MAEAARLRGLPGPRAMGACPAAPRMTLVPPHAGARQGIVQGAQGARRRTRVLGMHAGKVGQAWRETRGRWPAGPAGGRAHSRPPRGRAASRALCADAPPRCRGAGPARPRQGAGKPAGVGAPRLHGMPPCGRSRVGRGAKRPSPRGGAQARARREEAALCISRLSAAAEKTGRAAQRPRACGRPPPRALRRRFPERPRLLRPLRPAALAAACAMQSARARARAAGGSAAASALCAATWCRMRIL